MNIASHILLLVIRAYQWCISPWFGTCCRFDPSCSHYAAESIRRYGLLKGVLLAAHRILRCHPFGDAGFDPVPGSHRK